jgi:formylglycine-generating enzyme required for sulfatase activity
MTEPFGPLSTTRYAVNGVPFDTVRVPPGRFVDGEGVEKRELLVSRPFEIGTTLVNQMLWGVVMDCRNPSRFISVDLPVEQVSWDDAQVFLARLDALGLPGFRLPAEAEWVWAVRCGASTRWAGADRFKSVAVVRRRKTVPAGGLLPSAVGAFDFSGNLSEQQQDVWSGTPAAGVDAHGPASGSHRVTRGGGWRFAPQGARVDHRGFGTPGGGPGSRFDFLGLRLARTTP